MPGTSAQGRAVPDSPAGAAWSTQGESGLFPGSDEQPADILIPLWTLGRDTAIDVTVVNALQTALVGRVAADGGYAVAVAHT